MVRMRSPIGTSRAPVHAIIIMNTSSPDSATLVARHVVWSGPTALRAFRALCASAILILAAGLRADSGSGAAVATGDPILAGTMAELTSPEVEQAAKAGAIVLFPIAIIEEHGPHLDLTADIALVAETCRATKARLEKMGIKTVVVPACYWGVSRSTAGFPGTFAVSPETMKAIITDTVGCLKTWGFTTVFLVNGHGDPTHIRTQEDVAIELRRTLGIAVYTTHSLKPDGYTAPASPARGPNAYQPDYHAGAVETAMMQALRPQAVRPAIARELKPQAQFAPLGYAGNPAGFAAEDGQAWLNHAADEEAGRIAAFLQQRGTSLP